jgi:hypothetical protein
MPAMAHSRAHRLHRCDDRARVTRIQLNYVLYSAEVMRTVTRICISYIRHEARTRLQHYLHSTLHKAVMRRDD